MMKEFELLYQIDEHNYIIPGLLSEGENTYEFKQDEPLLTFHIEYVEFMPASIIPRLMVKLNKYIYQNQTWKTGMVLEEKLLLHSIANVVLDKENKKIQIEIQGKRRRDFLTVIREVIKEVNASYQNIEIIEWIPLPKLFRGETLLVDYQELLGYEDAQQENYFSGKLRESFLVSDLLNGVEKPEIRLPQNSCHVFISYSQKDNLFLEELSKHLMPLIRLNKATKWDDKSIDAGSEWEEEILENLEKADIVLCLMSPDYIASDFCDNQLKIALESHKEDQKVVVPIRIRKVRTQDLPIAKLKGLPKQHLKSENDDDGWVEVIEGLENVIKMVIERKSIKA